MTIKDMPKNARGEIVVGRYGSVYTMGDKFVFQMNQRYRDSVFPFPEKFKKVFPDATPDSDLYSIYSFDPDNPDEVQQVFDLVKWGH